MSLYWISVIYPLWCIWYGFRGETPEYFLKLTWWRFFRDILLCVTVGLLLLPIVAVCDSVDALKERSKRKGPSKLAAKAAGLVAGQPGRVARILKEAELEEREQRIKELEKELGI